VSFVPDLSSLAPQAFSDFERPTEYLDALLEEVCIALQLSDSQFNLAQQRYHAIGDWLGAEGSALAQFVPRIYPQGSIALQTTVRPRRDRDESEEFDIDLVCELGVFDLSPVDLLERVGRRLAKHETYRHMLEPLKRCWRLNYAGEFHLDVLPAIPDLARGGSTVLVPDRELHEWCPSNPRGFARWFNERAALRALVERKAEPLPPNAPAVARPPLKLVVQLLKRRRDIFFGPSDLAPRSVVLTTLAALVYEGSTSVSLTIASMLGRLCVRRGTIIPDVPNPTNRAENFAEAWQRNPAAFDAYCRFVDSFAREWSALFELSGYAEIQQRLGQLFGEEPTKRAVEALAERVQRARNAGVLRVGPAVGLTTVRTSRSHPIHRHDFHGEP
jgi:Second Messenger Oligonucleotide or Dinucleotide Synthetase domain